MPNNNGKKKPVTAKKKTSKSLGKKVAKKATSAIANRKARRARLLKET